MATMVDVICAIPTCGKPFQRTLRQYNYSKTKRFYCCSECQAKSAHDKHGSGIDIPSREELEQMLHVDGMSYSDIAKRYNVDQSAVYYWRKRHGIKSRKTWLDTYAEPGKLQELANLYESGATLAEIAELHKCNRGSVRRLFAEKGIQVRDDGFDGGKRYLTQDGKRVRSSYECKVANWLIDSGIEYTYEPSLPFSARGKSDFHANGWYIEVWGVVNSPSYILRKQKKITLYQSHNIPLIELPAHSFALYRNGLWERKLSQCLALPATETDAVCQPKSWVQSDLGLVL